MDRSCYVDSSAILKAILEQDGHEQAQERYDVIRDRGYRFVSSQLLELECRRAQVREQRWLSWDAVQPYLDDVSMFDLSLEDWNFAMYGIPYHVKSLDALHLAACMNIQAAVLLSSDDGLNDAAGHMGIELA